MSLLYLKPPLYFLARGLQPFRDENGEQALHPDTELVAPLGEDGEPRLAIFTTKQLAIDYANHHGGFAQGVEWVEIASHDLLAWLLEEVEYRRSISAIILDMNPETEVGTAYTICYLLDGDGDDPDPRLN